MLTYFKGYLDTMRHTATTMESERAEGYLKAVEGMETVY